MFAVGPSDIPSSPIPPLKTLALMFYRFSIAFACLLMLAGFTPAVRADLVVGTFSGQVSSINPTTITPPVSLGMTYVGMFQFEGNAIDVDADTTSGKYFGALTTLSLTFSNGFQAATLLPVNGHVLVDSTAGTMRLVYPFATKAPTSDPAFEVDTIDMLFHSAQPLLTDDLPSTFNNAASAGTIYSAYNGGTPGSVGVFDFSVSVDPNSVSLTSVPEPSAWLLLLLATALIAGFHRVRTWQLAKRAEVVEQRRER